MSYRVQILHGSSYEKCQAVIKLSSNTKIQKYKNTKIQKYKNTKIQKYKNTQNNSPAPAINTQKEKKSKKIKNAKTQKEKKRKTCKKSNKIKKCTFAPAISTSYLLHLTYVDDSGYYFDNGSDNNK